MNIYQVPNKVLAVFGKVHCSTQRVVIEQNSNVTWQDFLKQFVCTWSKLVNHGI